MLAHGEACKFFCTTNLWAIECKVACPVIKLQFFGVDLFDRELSCLLYQQVSHTAFCHLQEGENPETAGRTLFGSGLLTAVCGAAAGLCTAPVRTGSHAG